jgi:hypothetical protein
LQESSSAPSSTIVLCCFLSRRAKAEKATQAQPQMQMGYGVVVLITLVRVTARRDGMQRHADLVNTTLFYLEPVSMTPEMQPEERVCRICRRIKDSTRGRGSDSTTQTSWTRSPAGTADDHDKPEAAALPATAAITDPNGWTAVKRRSDVPHSIPPDATVTTFTPNHL